MRFVEPSIIAGIVDAPPSKSMMQRAVIAAALAEGESRITNPSFCDDALAALKAVEALGAKVERDVGMVRVIGTGGPEGRGMPGTGRVALDCGESGTCMRMLSAVVALYDEEFTITGKGSLMKRPAGMIEGPLRMLGAECITTEGKPPLKVKGPMHGGTVEVDGSESSQFVSGLLMALPLCREDSEMTIKDLKSRAYVRMTMTLVSTFGVKTGADERMERFLIKGGQRYRPIQYAVEGDWSGAAFLLVAGAIAGEVSVRRLESGSQPDQAIMAVLKEAGAEIKSVGGTVSARKGALEAFEFDATGSPDLFPPLSVLACCCRGKSVIRGADRLRGKESDRAAVLARELGKIGADIKVDGDRMEITGSKLKGGRIDTHNDHRIAMAGAIAGLVSGKGVEIENESCVSKSYPGFFRDLESLVVG